LELGGGDKSPIFNAMSAKLPRGTLDKLWSDPVNWHGWGFYYCKDDPRTVVPKRIKWTGWTINFAHASAWINLLTGIAAAVVPTFLLKMYGNWWLPLLWIAVLILVSWVTGWAKSSPNRYEND
jgi:hypothetical protein